MLRYVGPRLAVGAFTMFMMEQKHNPAFIGLTVADRGRMTAKLYHALSPKDHAALKRRALRAPSLKRRPPQKPKPFRPSRYHRFLKAHINDPQFKKLSPPRRMAEIAKLWRSKQKTAGGATKPSRMKTSTKRSEKSSPSKVKTVSSSTVTKPAKKVSAQFVKRAARPHKKTMKLKKRTGKSSVKVSKPKKARSSKKTTSRKQTPSMRRRVQSRPVYILTLWRSRATYLPKGSSVGMIGKRSGRRASKPLK